MPVSQPQLDYLSAMGIPVWISRDLPLPELAARKHGLKPALPDLAGAMLESVTVDSKPAAPTAWQNAKARPAKTGLQGADQLIKDLQQSPVKQIAELVAELDETVTPEPAIAVKDLEGTDWIALDSAVSQCNACDLHTKRQHTVFGKGSLQADVMIVGDIPRLLDEQQKQPFSGDAGDLLTQMLKCLELESDKIYFTNLLKCRPPLDNSPQPNQAASCLSYLKQQIKLLQPQLVLLMGRSTTQYTLGNDLPMAQLRQKLHQIEGINTQFIATYHPAYLLKQPRLKAQAWQDLQFIKQSLIRHG